MKPMRKCMDCGRCALDPKLKHALGPLGRCLAPLPWPIIKRGERKGSFVLADVEHECAAFRARRKSKGESGR